MAEASSDAGLDAISCSTEEPIERENRASSEIDLEPATQLGIALIIAQAIDICDNTLSKRSKKRLHQNLLSTDGQSSSTLEELLGGVQQFKDYHNKNYPGAQRALDHAIKTVHERAQVVDVLIQQQQNPNITAFMWKSIQSLIEVAAKETENTESLASGIIEIVTDLGRWEQYDTHLQESERLQRRAALLLSHVVQFLLRAGDHYRSSKTFRFLKLSFAPSTVKFEGNMKNIRTHAQALEHEFNLEVEFKEENERKAQDTQKQSEREEHYKEEKLQQEVEIYTKTASPRGRNTYLYTPGDIAADGFPQDVDTVLAWLQQHPYLPLSTFKVEEGSCAWIQNHETYLNWTKFGYKKPLCIYGPAGCGKTGIAHFLADFWKTKMRRITIPYFFQSTTNREYSTPTSFAFRLIAQVLQLGVVRRSPQYVVAIGQLKGLADSERRVGDHFSFELLWPILCYLLEVIGDITLIVDGLDECDDKLRKELCLRLVELASEPNIRLILLFRNDPEMETVIEKSHKIEITPELTAPDISLYVHSQIQEYSKKLERHHDKIIQKVPSWSQGSFLLVSLMMEGLRQAETHNTQLDYLSEAPSGLEQLYEKLLSNKSTHLSESRHKLQKEIFLILLQMSKAPSYEEIRIFLALHENASQLDEDDMLINLEDDILQLCYPLVRVAGGHVVFTHDSIRQFLVSRKPSPDAPLYMTVDESNAFLARKCLLALSQKTYKSLGRIATLFRQNVSGSPDGKEEPQFYQYAATHWFIHLFAVADPETRLVELVAKFLGGFDFVYWSEYIFSSSRSQKTVLEVGSKLKVWAQSLSPNTRKPLEPVIDNYFTGPYRTVSDALEQYGGDKSLPYLCLFQLGAFYSLSSHSEKAFEVRQIVSDALMKELGERNSVALTAESALAREHLLQGHLRIAQESFSHIARIQQEVVGNDSPDYYRSLQGQGMAEYGMASYAEATTQLTKSLEGLFNTVGVTDSSYLLCQQTIACILESQGEIKRAAPLFEHIWRHRTNVSGPDDSLAVWSRYAMSSVYRKAGLYEEAGIAIDEVIKSREKTVGSGASATADAYIQKIILHREADKRAEALELIESISKQGSAKPWFERTCQIEHVRALLVADEGNLEMARKILQSLVEQALSKGDEGRNRSMLWVRLDLATILRKQNKEEEASMLFLDLVEPKEGEPESSWEALESPRDLEIAESAIRHIRKLEFQQAQDLLQRNGAQWVREEDFWIMPAGGPGADTGWMREPVSE
ncbi:hypothetical protein F5884DRAFT_443080 [Xylogone sp. PMI_703]|nr:hypothetical protein F5884DRAFT_443080 [Xylogone sp. PMI_703]